MNATQTMLKMVFDRWYATIKIEMHSLILLLMNNCKKKLYLTRTEEFIY